jgi:hypothetical protein
MKPLMQYVQLRPHGEKMLLSSARFWFRSVSVLILAMAISEAVAWAYLGYLFGSGTGRYITATFAGGIMFIVVWIIDTSLVTLDRAWGEHARALLGARKQSWFGNIARDVFRFGLRIGLLLASLTVSSPYLAQVVFHRDIEAVLSTEAVNALNDGRAKIATQFGDSLAALRKEIIDKRAEYETEVAGKGRSGRYGAGPAAQAMLGDLQKLEEERNKQLAHKDEALIGFDSLAKNWQANRSQIVALYNLRLPEISISENRRVLDELRKRPENQATELAVKAFLAIVFSGLLLLKMFEPSSVRLYLSEVLQQEYDRYLAGAFDAMLPPFERSTQAKAPIPPQRLYGFLSRVWVPAANQPRAVEARQSLALLEEMQTRINGEVDEAKAEVERVCKAANDAEQSLTELKSAIVTVGADLQHFRKELTELDDGRSGNDLDAKAKLAYQSLLRNKIAKADRTLNELQDAIPAETSRRNRASAAIGQVETRLKYRQSELLETQQKIREVRSLLSAALGNAATAAIGASAI